MNKIKNKLYICIVSYMYVLLSGIDVFADAGDKINVMKPPPQFAEAFKNFYNVYSSYINIGLGFAFLTGLLAIVISIIRLGKFATNPNQRAKIINDILIAGICISIIGAVQFFILFYISIFS